MNTHARLFGWKRLLFVVSCLFSAASFSMPPDLERILTAPGYWEVARPEEVRKLIAGQSLAGVRVQERYDGRTLLMLAAERTRWPEVIAILVEAGSEVNAATEYRNEVLLTRSGTVDVMTEDLSSALHFAVLNPNPSILAALLRYKPDMTARAAAPRNLSALELAAKRTGRTEHLRLLLQAAARQKSDKAALTRGLWRFFLGYDRGGAMSYDGSAPLIGLNYARSILHSDKEAAAKTRLLIDSGVSPDLDALGRALASGHNEAARLILNAGVNPAGTIRGASMLTHALTRPGAFENPGYAPIDAPGPDPMLIRRLLAVPGAIQGEATLERACRSGLSVEIVKLLVKAGAPYRTLDNTLMFAALEANNDNVELIAYLLVLGFSAQDRGNGRLAPLAAAARFPRQKPRSALLLAQSGATPADIEDLVSKSHSFAERAGLLQVGQALSNPQQLWRDEERLRAEKAHILELARNEPGEALYWPIFYRVATPDEVRELIADRSLAGIRVVKTKRPARSGAGDLGGAMAFALPFMIFQESFWTGKVTVEHPMTPLIQAARTTQYPEVIDLLIKAGCQVTDLDSKALLAAVYNPNPAVLEAVLRYRPNLGAEMFYLGTPLHSLAAEEAAVFKKEHFRLLLASGSNVNATSGQDRETPLMRAAFYGNTEAGRMLLAGGARTDMVNRVGETALDIAVGRSAWALAREILKAGGKSGRDNPLRQMAANKSADETLLGELLESLGVDSREAGEAIVTAARKGNDTVLNRLLAAGAVGDDRQGVLRRALAGALSVDTDTLETPRDNPALIALLLQYGADANAMVEWSDGLDLNALHRAAYHGLPKALDVLLKAGFPVDTTDRQGKTPLYWSVFRDSAESDPYRVTRPEILAGCTAAAKRLLLAGADIHREADGVSPFLLGLRDTGLTSLFIKEGGKGRINAAAGNGFTPLTYAANHARNADAIPLLLLAGADARASDARGRTPLAVAMDKQNGRAMAYLAHALPARSKSGLPDLTP